MRNFILFLFLPSFFLTSCEKELETRIIKGHIYKSCEEPLSDFSLTIMGRRNSGISYQYDILGNITTNEKGFYYLNYESNKNYKDISFYETALDPSMTIIKVNYEKNLDLFHYVDGRSTHNIVLSLNDTFSIQDTLYFGFYSIRSRSNVKPPFFALPGPFEENKNYKLKYGEIREYSPWFDLNSKDNKINIDLFWALGRKEYNAIYLHDDTLSSQVLEDVQVPVCGMGSDLAIDLKNKGK